MSTASQSRALAAVGSRIPYGLCLRYTRTWLGAPAKYPTAASAWSHAQYRHAGELPPTGAIVPVWFKYTNPAGHVALHLADGTVVTVNGFKVSRFESVGAMSRAGFGAYLGWAEDLNGVRVYQPTPTPTPAPAPVTEQEEPDMLTILRTAQHGIYTVAPGCVIAHVSDRVSKGLEYLGKATIIDVAPDDLADYIFTTSGCPRDSIPAPGYAWSITATIAR